jgi:hypothetical protein
MYAAVNTTLYRYFAIVGGAYQVVAIALAFILAVLVRERQPAFIWTASGVALLLAAFIVWFGVVEPVNRQVADVMRTQPDAVAAAWTGLRDRRELGHAAGFVLQLVGFGALLYSVIVETRGSRGALA